MNDYLNYFLPINNRDVNFPTFSSSNLAQSTTSQSIHQNSIFSQHRPHHHSLFKRVIQKSMTPDDDGGLGVVLGESDRISDIKKIDLFLRLINECLINPFTESCDQILCDKFQTNQSNLMINNNPMTAKRKSPTHISPSSSPLKYDPKQQLSNLENIFALSMILKHSHLFVNAYPIDYQSVNKLDMKHDILSKKSTKYSQSESPLDEFRMLLFRVYWRKSFYKFFIFHFEHWPLTPSIKWSIELWLTYIQSWKFNSKLMENRDDDSLNLLSEFIKENFLIYNDMYQSIVKRYCILDLTNNENIQILGQILIVFMKEKDLIKKSNFIFFNFNNIIYHNN